MSSQNGSPITVESVRKEVQHLLQTVAGSGTSSDTVKAAINRAVAHLDHPELGAGVIKRLWYGEQTVMPAHLVDHIRRKAARYPRIGFALESQGRIVSLSAAGSSPPATVRFEDDRIVITLNARAMPSEGVVVLQHWLLTSLGENRSFRVVDMDRAIIHDFPNAIDVLERLGDFFSAPAPFGGQLLDNTMMIVGSKGIAPLVGERRERLCAEHGSDQWAVSHLVRSGGYIAFIPEADRLTVFARTETRSDILDHACSWLTAHRKQVVRVRVWVGHGWINEIVKGSVAAALRLRELAGLAPLMESPALYRGRRIRIEEMMGDEINYLAPLLAHSGRPLEQRMFAALQRRSFGDRLGVMTVDDGMARVLYHPPGLDFYGATWWIRAPGQRVVDQPDRAYGQEVNQRIVASVSEGVPHIERIEARIRESDDDGCLHEARLSKYTRVAVPCRCGNMGLVILYSIVHRWDEPLPGSA